MSNKFVEIDNRLINVDAIGHVSREMDKENNQWSQRIKINLNPLGPITLKNVAMTIIKWPE
jgi:hypothetical protein